jgi:hypothetical protein
MQTKAYQNIFLKHVAEKYTSESRWITIIPMDLEVYTQHLNGVRFHFREINQFLLHCSTKVKQHRQGEDLGSIVQLLKGQQAFAQQKVQDLREQVRRIKQLMQPDLVRQKRSLIPFLGDILHGLTGVPTEEDMNEINQQIHDLTNQDEELSHIVEDSLTIVNVTQYKLEHVSKTVNSMLDAMAIFQDLVYNNTQDVFEKIDTVEMEFRCWGQNSVLITTLLHNLNTVSDHIATLNVILADLLRGQLTTNVIKPDQLLQILMSLRDNIASDLEMPYSLENNLVKYYKSIATHLVFTNHRPTIIIAIPLKSILTKFHMKWFTYQYLTEILV